jgi:copper chaperone CopZ
VSVQTETFHVTGIRCERCVLRLGGVLGRLDGLEAANANLIGQVVVSWDDERLERVAIVEALSRAGFRAAVV